MKKKKISELSMLNYWADDIIAIQIIVYKVSFTINKILNNLFNYNNLSDRCGTRDLVYTPKHKLNLI